MDEVKCVMVIDAELPPGIAANTAAVLGITLGSRFPEAVGPDVTDARGRAHMGITSIPVPILKAGREALRELREQLYGAAYRDLAVVDFTDVAQSCNTYGDFIAKAAQAEDFTYLGLGVRGDKKLVNRLTGSLPLYR